MRKHFFALFILLFFIAGMAFSQHRLFNVWEGEIPGSIENPNYVSTTDSSGNVVKTYKVSNPTLDYYPAENNAGLKAAVVICPGGAYRLLANGMRGRMLQNG